ncbi:MAG: radical SAM protein, partial [Defluviitaleaceae bacterium]|nr:radical SAM protein [Defluviitaleaceae bacterium]
MGNRGCRAQDVRGAFADAEKMEKLMGDVPTVPAKNIVNKVQGGSEWFGVDYNMNIYRGCSHGCIYCDSRSDCFRVDDFDTVKVKENALQIIRDDLRRKVRTGVVATGAMSDPYNPREGKLLVTRNALELINAFGFGVTMATKSALVARDADVLKDISENSPTLVKMTITAADDALCRSIEPNVSPTSKRFEAMSKLADKGVFCGVLMLPVLPYVTDSADNIINILRIA